MTQVEEFDVAVVGGGPAGSTLASLVAKQGHRVLLLERETFPRYQIGESLLPSTVHGICKLLGLTDELAAAGFTVKRGGTFRWGANAEPWTFAFDASPRMAGPASFAYQVERSKFDHILLRNAGRLGAEVREGCSVTDVVVDRERIGGVTYTDAEGAAHTATARYVVDASGNRSRLYGKVGGTRKYSEFFRSLALFGYFENGRRLPKPNNGNILSVAFDSGWFWYIPLSDTLTSVGAVVRREDADKIQGDPEKAMSALIAECPLISEYLADATRVTEGQYGEFRVRKDYSYHQTTFWRPGMLLIGDAACFVDPVFSSGVHLATYSALLAARSLNSILAGIVPEQPALEEFEARYRREYGVFYEFLASFYQMHESEDSYFWSAKKVTSNTRSDLESFVELVGGVSSGEPALANAEAVAQRMRSKSREFRHAIDDSSETGTMDPLFHTQLIRDVVTDSSAVRMNALLGDGEAETPLFEGGLVPSADSMFWVPATS